MSRAFATGAAGPALALGLALSLLAPYTGPAQSTDEAPAPGDEAAAARLAVEEAELRERMITALAVAEGVRLKGRTVLVALTELRRVRRTLSELSPTDPERRALERRLDRLEGRRRAVTEELDREFATYLEIVAEISTDLYPRLNRVGEALGEALLSRRLENLSDLLPITRAHIVELNREGDLSAAALQAWREEIDDTYAKRREILEGGRDRPAVRERDRPDRDI
ncbi:MAG: hypothetical protein ACFBWO_18925 [Paracoccaceae bacterium]